MFNFIRRSTQAVTDIPVSVYRIPALRFAILRGVDSNVTLFPSYPIINAGGSTRSPSVWSAPLHVANLTNNVVHGRRPAVQTCCRRDGCATVAWQAVVWSDFAVQPYLHVLSWQERRLDVAALWLTYGGRAPRTGMARCWSTQDRRRGPRQLRLARPHRVGSDGQARDAGFIRTRRAGARNCRWRIVLAHCHRPQEPVLRPQAANSTDVLVDCQNHSINLQ